MKTTLPSPSQEIQEIKVKPHHFFILTFTLSWLLWIALDFSHFEIGWLRVPEEISSLLSFLGVLMPAAAAFILSGWTGGKKAVSRLIRRSLIWQVSWKWWAAATLVYPGLLVISALSYNLFRGNQVLTFVRPEPSATIITNIVFLLIASLGEEFGWRGVALPGLQQKRGPLASSIILGLCWGVWHLPFWLLQDSIDQFGAIYLVMNFLMLPITFYITWFFNHSKFSILLPVVFHLTFNIVNTILLPVTMNIGAFGIFIVLEWLLTLLILPRLETGQRKTIRSSAR